MQTLRLLIIIFLAFLIAACGTQPTVTKILPLTPTFPSNTSTPDTPPTVEVFLTPSPASSCEKWQSRPIVPAVSDTARALYQRGQKAGNNPRTFSKIGDGEISAAWFFTAFDLGQRYYDLGDHQDLAAVIEYFAGSFGRIGVAAKRGFNTARILEPAMNDSTLCESSESPLACELRLRQPAFAILSLGTNQVWQPEKFEAGMRQILNILVSKNVVPILSTKGDNLEGDHHINHTIACLAEEYDLPLWNFWSAIQPLPNHGLQPDLEHLTYGITDFDDPHAMQSAWTIRNLTALQVLDAVWRGVTAQP